LHLEEYGPGGRSQKHGHVNEAAFYILDGEGYEVHDGVRYDWKAGDVAIVHNNCVHQHFNASATNPARALVIKTKPMYMFMNMLFQQQVEPRPSEPLPGAESFQAREAKQRFQSTDIERPKERTMAWSESKAWNKGTANQALYQALLDTPRRRRRATRSARRWCTRRTCRGSFRAMGSSSTS
jgi:gentisate 1,2-dioxygenase